MSTERRESCVAGEVCILPSLAGWRGEMREMLASLRADRNRYQAALERIEAHGSGYAVGIARAALEGDQ